MKVRFGFTCRGQADLTLDAFPQLVDDLERLGFDSLWLPELMLNGPFDPLVGLAHAAARTTRLKLGAYLIVPGRNPVRLARELANLDRLSGGRLLLIMVLGQPNTSELLAQHVSKAERGALLEEVLPLLRRLWSGDVVDHDGYQRAAVEVAERHGVLAPVLGTRRRGGELHLGPRLLLERRPRLTRLDLGVFRQVRQVLDAAGIDLLVRAGGSLESLPEALAEAGRQLRTLSVRLPASVLPRRHLNNLS